MQYTLYYYGGHIMQPRRSPRARRAVLDCAHIWSCGSKQIRKQKQIQVQLQIHIQKQKHVCLSLCSHNSGPASQNRLTQFFKLKETIYTNPQAKHGCGRKLGWSGSQQVQHSWLFVWPMGGREWANWHLGRVEAGCTTVGSAFWGVTQEFDTLRVAQWESTKNNQISG